MRLFTVILLCLSFVGCCSGVDPKSVTFSSAPVTYAAQVPATSYGVAPAAKRALMIPADTAACLARGAAGIVDVAIGTARCVIDTIAPTVVPVAPVQSAPLAAPVCPSGACGVPAARAAGCR